PPYTIYAGQEIRLPGAPAPAQPVRVAEAAPRAAPVVDVGRGAPAGDPPAATAPDVVASAPVSREAIATAEPPPTSGSGFIWPLRGRVISTYGTTPDGLHNDGVNIAAPGGAPIRAAENGVVAYSGS